MCKNRGSKVEPISASKVKSLFGVIRAYADEAPSSAEGEGNTTDSAEDTDGKSNAPTINYEDLIAKARKEEKEKQYKTIDKLKGEKDTLTKQHNEDLLKLAELEKKVEEANKKLTDASSGDTELVKSLKDEIVNLNSVKAELEKEVNAYKEKPPVDRDDIAKEIRAELEAEYEVKSYKLEKLAELKDDILVPELVVGSTKEEIDASLQVALERSKQIRATLGAEKKRPKSPSNPSIQGIQDTEISLEKLATMDVRSKEYADLRAKLGLH